MRTRVHAFAFPARIAAALLTAVSTFFAGCSDLDTRQIWPWSTVKVEKPQPARMTVAWTHATQAESGRPLRGFRGRIFFYPKDKSAAGTQLAEKDRDKPMKVEGTLSVYAFDVLADGKLSPTAPRKFVFKPDQFQKQLSEAKQGPSYEVWLPWDGVDGPPKRVELWTRFDGVNQGAVVMSDHSPQLLPGVSQVPDVSRIAAGERPKPRPSSPPEKPLDPITQTAYQSADPPPASASVSGKHSDGDSSGASTADWWK
jgi:hypothetical protein